MIRAFLNAAIAATFILCLPVPAAAQSFSGPQSARVAPVMVFDADDDGVIPFTLETPLGTAHLYVFHGWASLHVAGFKITAPLANMPMLPGMQEATVGTTGCWGTITPTGTLVIVPLTVTGSGTTLSAAVADYHEACDAMEEAGMFQVSGADCDGGDPTGP
jgi:hypothetical protein